MNNAYYSADEARKVLGNIHPFTLSKYVESGILNRYVPPGKKRGFYLKSEVDALAEQIRKFYQRSENGKDSEHDRERVINSS